VRESRQQVAPSSLVLDAETAADLMTPNPISIRQDMSLSQAVELLSAKDVSAVPVLDDVGHPVGVLSRTDIIRYLRETGTLGAQATNGPGRVPSAGPGVRDVMTAAFLSVPPATTAVEVVAQLLGLGNVQQLFVLDEAGIVSGVISARDILRQLRRSDG
jgi:CBS domain-containing protein